MIDNVRVDYNNMPVLYSFVVCDHLEPVASTPNTASPSIGPVLPEVSITLLPKKNGRAPQQGRFVSYASYHLENISNARYSAIPLHFALPRRIA